MKTTELKLLEKRVGQLETVMNKNVNFIIYLRNEIKGLRAELKQTLQQSEDIEAIMEELTERMEQLNEILTHEPEDLDFEELKYIG